MSTQQQQPISEVPSDTHSSTESAGKPAGSGQCAPYAPRSQRDIEPKQCIDRGDNTRGAVMPLCNTEGNEAHVRMKRAAPDDKEVTSCLEPDHPSNKCSPRKRRHLMNNKDMLKRALGPPKCAEKYTHATLKGTRLKVIQELLAKATPEHKELIKDLHFMYHHSGTGDDDDDDHLKKCFVRIANALIFSAAVRD